MSLKTINIEPLSKNYTDLSGYTIRLFENIYFEIEPGKITTLLAPKGTGKSTILKMIAGIDENSKKSVGKRICIPTKPSSFPWLSVRENLAFNLKKVDDDNLEKTIKFVGLEGYEDHFPNNGSVGFRFRISLARAIFNNPELILIDESISTLPLKRKMEFYSLLRKVTTEKGIPIIYSTSLVSEAIRLSDKIILIDQLPSKIVSEKIILIDEETRVDDKIAFNISDYFTEEEISILSNRII